jgi:hypothetical protein
MLEVNEDVMGTQEVLGLASGDNVTYHILQREKQMVPFNIVSCYRPPGLM